MVTLDEIETALRTPNRETLIELADLGDSLPRHVKAIVYISIQSMSDRDIASLCGKALEIIPLLRSKDYNGVRLIAAKFGIPVPLIEVIVTHAQSSFTQ